jgi:signal transduction histidine kinase
MTRRAEDSDAHRDEIDRLRREAGILNKELALLRGEAARAKQAAGPEPGARMDLLRDANEKLVIATMTAQAATEEAENSNREKEHFLAMLAHELRNPLAPIGNALAIMRRTKSSDPTLVWVHDIIKRQVDHLTQLLNELLEVSRLTSGKVVLKKRPIEIAEAMRVAIEAARPLIQGRRQRLGISFPPLPLVVDGDQTRLVQIFSNLLHNSAKYTHEGGTIHFSAAPVEGHVVLRIVDNGSGIAAAALPHIFDLFTQEGSSLDHAQGGLGIGLTVVRSLVELHGGNVTAASPGPGAGSEFVVSLPLMPNPPLVVPRVVEDELEVAGRPLRIALVDDNVDANDSLAAVLRMMGHQVETAFDGKAGLELIRESRPQVVVCDIGLPLLNGYQLMTQLRETMQPPLPAMIALTGYGLPEDRARSLDAGFNFHLTKPVDIEALLRLIAAQG